MNRRHVLLAALGALLLNGCSQTQVTRFPRLQLVSLDAPTDLYGTVLVNFWATWCAPCRREMASLERLSRILEGRVRVVGVCVDEDLNLAREWLRKEGIGFAQLADPGMRAARGALALNGLPETLLVAPDRRILMRVKGAREWDSADSVAAILDALASERARNST